MACVTAAVFAVDVLDDFFAPVVFDVEIDVRGFGAFARQKSLEQ